jgi:hypothetical protein
MLPHRTVDRLGVENVCKLLQFKSHDAYAVIGIDLNDLCALAARLAQPMEDPIERLQWQERLGDILREALHSNLTEA